jgi:hypothetical protein
VHDELQRMWKEVVVVYFKALFQYSVRQTEDPHTGCPVSWPNLNLEPSDYDAVVMRTKPGNSWGDDHE